MLTNRKQRNPVWRATLVLCVLLFAGIGPSVKLMLAAPVTCGMACCEESGICYCLTPPSETDLHEAHDDRSVLDTIKLQPTCPAQCAQLPASAPKQTIAKAPPVRWTLRLSSLRHFFWRVPSFARDTLVAAASAPRAPPVLAHAAIS